MEPLVSTDGHRSEAAGPVLKVQASSMEEIQPSVSIRLHP
jgi:hypothetical protein